ncbi:MAG: hypothetical protein PHP69_03255 [Candidatus Omnitrophica bacterium]|nr:hypothetical protein [Candidatus Omnitrophota bacterium]
MFYRFIIILFLASFLCPINKVFAGFSGMHGFVETRYAVKLSDDKTKHDSYSLAEQRLQVKGDYFFDFDNFLSDWGMVFNFKSDFVLDEYFGGKTGLQLREANFSFTPVDYLDVKAGRQVLTWGTGEYLFINDMFPKDYVSFFAGREDEYLKQPSDAVKLSFYNDIVNLDIVAIPFFEPNTHAEGDRLSFFDSFKQGIAGVDSDRALIYPSNDISNTEYALRASRNFGSNEAAFYFFRGFDKSPKSYKDEQARELYYERLDVYGFSLRGPFMSGIANVEAGYLNSREDPCGSNRLIQNSMVKVMAGYNKDLAKDLNTGFQIYYERILDYADYIDNLASWDYFWDEHRYLLTWRITKLLLNQNLKLTMFTFYSFTDKDAYFRPLLTYAFNDNWEFTIGANIPVGEDYITEFGQMEKDKNVFVGVRFNF